MHILIFKAGKTSPGILKTHPLLVPALNLVLLVLVFGFIYTLFLGRYERKKIVEFSKNRDYCETTLNLYGTTISAITDSIDLLEQKLVRATYKIPDAAAPIEGSTSVPELKKSSKQEPDLNQFPDAMSYTVQIASFKRRSDAERWKGSLAGALDREILVEPVELSNGRWFRVMVGRFASDSLALDFARKLVVRSVINEYVIQIIR